jgi:DNA polymerase-1
MLTLGEKAELALRAVREAPVIAYDTEGTGLDWTQNQPVGYVITVDRENNWYIPVRHGGGGNLNDLNCGPMTAPDSPTVQHSFEKALAAAFEERRRRKLLTVLHHAKFDMHFSANQGIIIGREVHDTQDTEAMLDEWARSYSLAAVAERRGVSAKKGDVMYAHLAQVLGLPNEKGAMGHFWRLPGDDEVAVDYATGDGITTLEVYRDQQAALDEEDAQGRSLRFIHTIESRLIHTVFRMERRGIKIDENKVDQVRAKVKEELEAAIAKLPPNFNVRSGPQMKKLMEDAGHTNWPTTPIGNPSFNEKWLKTHETGRSVIKVRKLTNLENTFIGPLVERHVVNGRVHATLNQLKADEGGTISGRFSCQDPNLQQVPKRDKELGPLFRSLFVADEGMEFYEADYSQCEPRLFAHYAQEKRLLEGYNSKPFRDVHTVVAEMFSVERDPTAKRMNMGIFTGMQVDAFAGHMDWPKEKAEAMHRAWFDEFSGIKKFQWSVKDVFRKRGYVVTILGRKCRLDQPRFAYRGVSRVIQGSNADILKYKLLQADEFLESIEDQLQLLMTVHDSVNWQAPATEQGRKWSAELVDLMSEVQTEPFNLRVPFVMDVGRGKDWSEATYGGKLG